MTTPPDEREPATRLDVMWDVLWEDLRHNATGRPSGLAIIARYRPAIEAEARAAADTALSLERSDHEETREALNSEREARAAVRDRVRAILGTPSALYRMAADGDIDPLVRRVLAALEALEAPE